jgi:methionine synthase II (cobalamin-independent)
MITKEELLENIDKYYEEFINEYQADKDRLISLLSPSAAKAAKLFEPKSKEEWLEDELKKYNQNK